MLNTHLCAMHIYTRRNGTCVFYTYTHRLYVHMYVLKENECKKKMQTSVFLLKIPSRVIHFYYMERLTHDNKSFVNSIRNGKLIMRYLNKMENTYP